MRLRSERRGREGDVVGRSEGERCRAKGLKRGGTEEDDENRRWDEGIGC